MSTMSSSLLTSKASGQHSKYGFFNQLHLIPQKHHRQELRSTQGPREHHPEPNTQVHDGNPAALRLTESCSPVQLSLVGHFPVTRVLAKVVTICSFCTLAARLHPGLTHHREPGNGLFTPGCASHRYWCVLPNLRGFARKI